MGDVRAAGMNLNKLAIAVALAAALAACATRGRVFDDAVTTSFAIGTTTPEQAIDALGPPTSDWTRPDGLRIIDWQYGRIVVISPSVRRVRANFREGRLIYLHAPLKDEEVSVF
jgi:hypothetical protein